MVHGCSRHVSLVDELAPLSSSTVTPSAAACSFPLVSELSLGQGDVPFAHIADIAEICDKLFDQHTFLLIVRYSHSPHTHVNLHYLKFFI